MLYSAHPEACHSTFVASWMPHSSDAAPQEGMLQQQDLLAMLRVAAAVRKRVLLLAIHIPEHVDVSKPACIHRFQVCRDHIDLVLMGCNSCVACNEVLDCCYVAHVAHNDVEKRG